MSDKKNKPEKIVNKSTDIFGDLPAIEPVDAPAAADQPAPDVLITPGASAHTPASDPFGGDPISQPGLIDFAALRAAQQHQNDDPARYSNAPITDNEAQAGDGDFFIDMATADARLKPMTPGTRVVVSCTGAEAKLSGSGNPMIALRVRVERVIFAAPGSPELYNVDAATYNKRTMRENMMFIPPNPTTGYRGTIWRANATLRAFGIEPDKGVYRSKGDFMAMLASKAEELHGRVADAEIAVDDGTNNGTKLPEVDSNGDPYPPKNTVARFTAYISPAPAGSAAENMPF